jgi:hypothetical protein
MAIISAKLAFIAFQVVGQAICKKADGFVTGIQLHGSGDVLLYQVGFAVVADRAKRLVRPEETIGSGKC